MAVNMALAVQYAAGVAPNPIHRNLATLKPKAANNNPKQVLKYDAAALLVAKKFRNTRPNWIITRRESRIMATAAVQVQQQAAGRLSGSRSSDSYTAFKLTNNTSLTLRLEERSNWSGTGDAPAILSPQTTTDEFIHVGNGETGSVEGLMYAEINDESVKWIVAWSTVPNATTNKVLTKIIPGKQELVWEDIYTELTAESTTNTNHAENPELGYQADITIGASSNKPSMVASLSVLSGSRK